MGEWKVAPFRRTMLVLRVRALESGQVAGVLRGLGDMFAGESGVGPGLDEEWGAGYYGQSPSQLSKCAL